MKNLNFDLGFRKYRFLIMLLFIIGGHSVHAALYLDDQISEIAKKISPLQSRLKIRQSELKAVTSTLQDDVEIPAIQKEQLIERQVQLAKESSEIDEKIQQWQEKLKYFKAKRALFPRSYLGENCEVFYESITNPKRFDDDLKKILQTFSEMFPGVVFSYPGKRLHVLIYKNSEDFAQFEDNANDFDKALVFHQSGCQQGIISIKKNNPIPVISLIQSESMHPFRHNLAHLCIFKSLNPETLSNAVSKTEANSFLDEGMAEYVANKLDGNGLEKATEVLSSQQPMSDKEALSQSVLNHAEFIGKDLDDLQMRFAESAFFIQWLAALPNGLGLYRQMLSAKPDQYEVLIRSNQMSRGVSATGFMEYISWKQTILSGGKKINS
jgi:hypothetical protein